MPKKTVKELIDQAKANSKKVLERLQQERNSLAEKNGSVKLEKLETIEKLEKLEKTTTGKDRLFQSDDTQTQVG